MNLQENINRIKKIMGLNENIRSCDIFHDKTGAQDYDEVLDDVEDRYLNDVVGEIVYMSPEEYLIRCSKMQDTTLEKTMFYLDSPNDNLKVNKLLSVVKSGSKLYVPYLDYVTNNQEGRHRAIVVMNLGCDEMKVAIFRRKDMNPIKKDLGDYIGVFSDVKEGSSHRPYVEYNLKDHKEYRMFLELYPYFEGIDDVMYRILNRHSCMMIPGDGDRYNDNFNVVKGDPEFLNSIIRQRLSQEFNDKDIEWGIEPRKLMDDRWAGFIELYSEVNSVNINTGKFGDLLRYLNSMVNGLVNYIRCHERLHFVDGYLGDEYNVEIDGKTARVYYSGEISGEGNSGKEILRSQNARVGGYVENDNEYIKINVKYFKEYMKLHPMK